MDGPRDRAGGLGSAVGEEEDGSDDQPTDTSVEPFDGRPLLLQMNERVCVCWETWLDGGGTRPTRRVAPHGLDTDHFSRSEFIDRHGHIWTEEKGTLRRGYTLASPDEARPVNLHPLSYRHCREHFSLDGLRNSLLAGN